MGQSTIQRTFAGGELAPALTARADLVKYTTGLRRCRNFLVLRSGGVANRPGTRFVAECKTNSISVQLHRYVSAVAGESLLIESGTNYLRFFKNGGPVMVSAVPAYNGGNAYVIGDLVSSGGVNYYCRADAAPGDAPPSASWYAMPASGLLEIPHTFSNGWMGVQSGNVITMTAKLGDTPPHELIYSSLTSWVIRLIDTKPGIEAPIGLVGTPTATPGTLTRAYQVTAGSAESYEESLSAGIASVPATSEPTIEEPVQLNWTAVPGAAEYYIYCDPYGNGTFGFIGTATATDAALGTPTVFNDVGFSPDFAVTPPLPRELFKTADEYPRVSGFHQQRRFLANTTTNPDAVYGSRVGFISNFNISSPLQDDDAITFKIAGNQHNPVRHLLGLKTLIVMTDAGAWNVGQRLVPLTPSNLPADQESYSGVAPWPPPVIVGNSALYVQARGSILRDLQFDQAVEGLAGRDLTIFASHLFDGFTLDSLAFQEVPHSTIWACRSDGTLLGLTYIREQEMWGWHRHDTREGAFEHVMVVPEQTEDVLYVLTRRDHSGTTERFIEKLESRLILNYDVDAFFVDCGLSYSGAPATTFSGLEHLEGQFVAVLADGVVVSNGWEESTSLQVLGGAVTIPTAASNVHIGLPIQHPEIESLDLDVQGSMVRDKRKRVGSVTLLVDKTTRELYMGPNSANLMPYKPTPWEGTAPEFTGNLEQMIVTEYNEHGRVFVQLRDPVPVTILGILPNLELGG